MTNGEINLGRWMTPDKLGGNVLNPQSLNRYAYALNSPATNIDPMRTDSMNFGGCIINGLPDGEAGWNGGGVYATNSCACAAASFEAAAPAGDASCSEPPFGPGYPPYPGGFGGGGAGYNPPAPPPPPPAGQPPLAGGMFGNQWVSNTTTLPGPCSIGSSIGQASSTDPCFLIMVLTRAALGRYSSLGAAVGSWQQQINTAGNAFQTFLVALHRVQEPVELTALAVWNAQVGAAMEGIGAGIIVAGCSGTLGVGCPVAVGLGSVPIASGGVILYGDYEFTRESVIPTWEEVLDGY